MAEIFEISGTPIVLASSAWGTGYYGFGAASYALSLSGLSAGAMRQSDKIDLGESRAPRYVVRIGFKYETAPSSGRAISVYWSASNSPTAGEGNDGGASGIDSTFASGSEAEASYLLKQVGATMVRAMTGIQLKTITTNWIAPSRYGSIIVWNMSNQAFATANDLFVALIPIRMVIQ